jgi:hypothetical protein
MKTFNFIDYEKGGYKMYLYEELLTETTTNNLIVKEKDLQGRDGLIKENRIAIRTDLTNTQKSCVLAEELGHYHMNVGNILDLTDPNNVKQEYLGRMWGYNRLIGLMGIIKAYEAGCQTKYEIADFLNVTEDFLSEALESYTHKYGVCTVLDNYTIYFLPCLGVMKIV